MGISTSFRMKNKFLSDGNNLVSELSEFCSSVDSDTGVSQLVQRILLDIKEGGDQALLKKTLLYDKVSLSAESMTVKLEELSEAESKLSDVQRRSLLESIDNVKLFHKNSIPTNWSFTNSHGAETGEKYYPINRVGIYVPGGNVPLISTVIMTVTLARVAQVNEIVVVTPPDLEGKIANPMLAALSLLGVTEVYKVGGAQAIAALAYGTNTILPVDKIYGPGNAFVNEAKRQVYGVVGIDLLPGPSEIMVISDSSSNPASVAAALLAQAEHGSGKEKLFLLFSEVSHFEKISNEINIQLESLSHKESIEKVLSVGFLAIFIPSFERIVEIANFIAPEHLELQVDDEHIEFFTKNITTAGAFLIGHYTSTSLGDFLAGPSHVLPTGRSSRFSSGLRLLDFLRRSSFIRYSEESAKKASSTLSVFADIENLDGHGKSHTIRL